MLEGLFQYLNSIYPMSQALQEYLADHLQCKTVQRKELLLKEGQVCKFVYYLDKGLLRCYYTKQSKEISSWFMKEKDMVISVESFFTQQPGNETIQAIEDCTFYFVGYEELQRIYHLFPEFNFIGRVITERYYVLSQQQLKALRLQRAPDRYHYLMHHFPELIQRVPATYLASYLGITLETLSRVKGQL